MIQTGVSSKAAVVLYCHYQYCLVLKTTFWIRLLHIIGKGFRPPDKVCLIVGQKMASTINLLCLQAISWLAKTLNLFLCPVDEKVTIYIHFPKEYSWFSMNDLWLHWRLSLCTDCSYWSVYPHGSVVFEWLNSSLIWVSPPLPVCPLVPTSLSVLPSLCVGLWSLSISSRTPPLRGLLFVCLFVCPLFSLADCHSERASHTKDFSE